MACFYGQHLTEGVAEGMCCFHALTLMRPHPHFSCTIFMLGQDYADKYTAARDAYIDAAEALKLATGPYKASRDAYVAASKSFFATILFFCTCCTPRRADDVPFGGWRGNGAHQPRLPFPALVAVLPW